MSFALAPVLEHIRSLRRRTHDIWEHVLANSELGRFWIPPLTFGLCATAFAYAHSYLAWATYLRANVLSPLAVPSLFGALYFEFAVVGVIAVWSYRGRWLRFATLCLLCLVLLVNSAQLVSTMFSSEFIAPALVRLAPLIGTIVSLKSVMTISLGTTGGLVVLWAGFRVTRWESMQFGSRVLATVTLAGWAIAIVTTMFIPGVTNLSARYGLRLGAPVWSLCRSIREAVSDAGPRIGVPTAEELRLALDAGITIHPNQVAPFRKDWIYKQPLPFPKRGVHVRHPNVIVLFFESWSAEVLGPYNPRWIRVTPNLNEFAQHAMRVDDYVNHAIPTVTGLRGQLCSMFPSLAYTPWHQEKKPVVGQVLCLPKLLADAGYESVYLNHGPASATHFDSQAIDWGFAHSYFIDEVTRDLLPGEKPGQNKADATDGQMMRATIALLEQKSAQARDDDRPLFLAVSTLQTHAGIDVPHKFGDGRNPVLNTFSNLDAAFGAFWHWYQKSSWAKDTILIVTGDHVLYPHDALRQVATPRHLNDRFGYLGLFIMDPTHELPASYSVRSTSIDFAPTLIQLLDLPSQRPNPFMGLSMFGDRQHTPIALGFNYGTDLLIWERSRTSPQIYHEPKTGRARQLFNVLLYEQQLERDRRIWFR